jgi:hypothetical protein
VAMTGDQPVGVVPVGELEQRLAQLLDGLEVPNPQQVFLESADEALGDAVAFGLAHEGRRGVDAEEGDLGLEVVRHVVGAVVVRCHVLPMPRKWRRTPCRTGSRAWKRLALLSAWMPTHSLLQWSTATKTWATPSTEVTVWLMSVPHMTSTVSLVMVPSCILSGRLRTRCGASNPFSRIRRRTRPGEVRMPAKRRRAQILR